MTDKLKELLPCPFCGDKHPLLSKYRNADPVGTLIGYVWRVECESCGANTCLGIERTEEQAVSTWNRRAPLPAVEAAEIEVPTVVAYDVDPGAASAMNKLQRCEPGADQLADMARRHGSFEPLMTVAQHRRILAGVNQQAGSEVPEGFVLAPERMHLDANVIEAINYHCGDGQENAGYGKHTDGLLWFGYVEDDDGVKSYGLNIATAEYPEEGSTQLVELKEPLPPSPAAKAGEA